MRGKRALAVRRRRVALGVLSAAVVSLASAAPASAQFAFDRFITSGNARAGWIEEPNAPPGDPDTQSISLFVNGTVATFGDSARALFKGFGTTPTATPPSFDFRTNSSGASGGSARFVLRFGLTDRVELRALTLAAGVWTHVTGAGDSWDSYGGSCGTRIGITYTQAVACHAGSALTGVEVLNDSGWLYPGGFHIVVDNVQYGGATITAPPPPVFGETVSLSNVGGEVVVRPRGAPKGSNSRLRGETPLPIGSIVDATNGLVKLVGSRGGKGILEGDFRGGTFLVGQSRRHGAKGLITLTLRGDLDCPATARAAGGATAESARRRHRRRLWGRGHGRFRTRGRYGSASVRGTSWFVEDRCDGTYFKVFHGRVVVFDATLRRTIVLRTGQFHLARSHRRR